jgi:surface protein
MKRHYVVISHSLMTSHSSIIVMFASTDKFNDDISKWDTSKVTDMGGKSKSCLF